MVHLALNQFDRKNFIRPIVYSTVIIACIFIAAGTALYHVNLTEFRTQTRKQQEIEAVGLKLLIDKNIINMKNDISIFSELKIVKSFLINPAADKSILYDSVKNVVERSRYFYQFRILNLSGYEIFRVNYLNGKAFWVPDGQLQDKSKRYYYREALALEKDQIMVSDYDYNIEMGKLEKPINPTFRIMTPIYVNNRKKAYLIINFNTNQLKEEVELLNRLTRFNIYIINKQRQFLCYKSFNVELERISEGADAQFVNELFSTKDFFSISNSYFFKIKIPLNKAEFNENGNFIYLAVELPADRFLAYKEILFRKILFYVLLLFVVTLAVVYVLLFLSVLTNKRAVQLRKAMKLLELSGDGVAVTDGKGDIEYVNPAFEKMYKCSLKETAGLNIANFNSSFYGEDFYTAMQARVDNTGKWEGDIVYMSGENTRQVKHLTIEKLPDPQTGQVMYFRVYKDITRLRDSDKQIKRLNSLDYLTGLPNKRMLLTRISEKIKKFSARGGKFAVSSISIYNFKQINDSYGFDIGDKTILLFAERIKGKIRNTDILGRLGDNHFLLVSNSSPPESLKHYIADIFRICTASPFMINEWEIYLSINVGISIYPDNGADGEELIKTASLARGDKLPDDRLAVNFYLDKMLLKAKEKSNMLSLLEKAIQRKELYLEFQPKVDSRNGELVGAEALTRWNNEKLGKVLPCDFIPLAVDNGLISKISYWVIRELCSQLKTWRERGLEIKPVSFNLSIYDLEREDFPSYLFACVDECGVESGDIQIELTERVLAKNKNKVIEKITQLKKRGFKVLIDDFGTGYSSLEYLKEFKMDTLKVDRAFIKDYPEKSKGEIVKTICELAESLGIEVVCEGVENKSQVDFLASIGCRIIQGFYYSPPVSPEVFADMLIEGKVKGREV